MIPNNAKMIKLAQPPLQYRIRPKR